MARKLSFDPERVFAGDRVAVSRAISLVENELDGSEEFLRRVFSKTGRAYRVGITGPPGAGKSTLTNKLALHYRKQGLSVGIIAVDPTSPFTGGALLGDRVRMTDVELDEGVFIRSMASRGSLGGLSKKAREAADVLDASGKDIIILETVGVGQSELDIAGAADTTVVVLVPESGDSIQAMKAGLMEIADFFVLNKADRAGADQAVMSIKMILHFKSESAWTPDVLKAIASDGTGVAEIAAKVAEHRSHLERTGKLAAKRQHRLEERIRELVADRLRIDFWSAERKRILSSRIQDVMNYSSTPYDLAHELINNFRNQ
ncbi:MAG: methylmalonyl Co-A mutase-associated GTPase MeaB [Ignavibacteriae bacterium]|nr:methylmalonyl Co-A mutase-associated GTPase MeaB [Ignavibacteriota bacterium]